tara:strand:+ start:1422 stop:2198 length:777 start_codon:yes stop_codon:yes gene_type:complete
MTINQDSVNKIVEQGIWYHTLLINGNKTKGTYDYTELVNELNFPDLNNLSVLDVGCSDGFFSKHFLENLSAKSVLGIDVNKYDSSVAFEVLDSFREAYLEKYDSHNDYPLLKSEYKKLGLENSNKFLLLKKIFNLNMDFQYGSIYDLTSFDNYDVTFCGSLLEHLRDPITAIEQLYSKTKNFCIIDISNTINPKLLGKRRAFIEYTGAGGNFYKYTDESIKLMMETVGFKNIKILNRYKITIEKYGYKIPHSLIIGYK